MNKLKKDKNGNVILPKPEEIPGLEKDQAAGSYIMMFASIQIPLPFIEIIMSVIYYLYFKNKSRFIAFHSYQSMITQIPVSILNAIGFFWLIRNIVIAIKISSFNTFFNYYFLGYVSFIFIWNIIYMIFSLIAYNKAGKGKLYYMLFFGRYAFEKFYGKNAKDYTEKKNDLINMPPEGY